MSAMVKDQPPAPPGSRAPQQTVQSVERAFLLLETMADAEGIMGVSALSAETGLPLPTIHRLIRTLVDLGYVHQDASRRYVLGPKLFRLGERSGRMFTFLARPHLTPLEDLLEETVNLTMLENGEVVYVAQAQSTKHSMRMFTEVGKRVAPHSNAPGKVMLAEVPRERVPAILDRTGMAAMTDRTITDRGEFMACLDLVKEQGYALDEGEQEVGVHAVAISVTNTPTRLALSVSGPASRITPEFVARAVPAMRKVALALDAELHGDVPDGADSPRQRATV
jgi:IclR family transcriptional regulator, acetate operon repressor